MRIRCLFYASVWWGLLLSSTVCSVQINIPDIEAISLTGTTYSRWMITGKAPGIAPFHSAFVADLFPSIKLNQYVTINYLLRIQNPSISDGVDAMQKVIGRYSVEISREFSGFPLQRITFKMGDLKKTTIGKGLLLKDFESQAFDLRTNEFGWTSGLQYMAHGYSLQGDYAIFYAHNDNKSLGGYVFSSIDDSRYFGTFANLIGLYTSIEMAPLTIDIESSYGVNGQSQAKTPFAAMISPKFKYEDAENKIECHAAARYYSQSFNAWFQKFYFQKTYHGIEEESEDFDNWRNYLLNAFPHTGYEENAQGLSVRMKAEHKIWEMMWVYGDIDISRQYYGSFVVDTTLYRYGGQIRLSPKQVLYAGINNKVLASDAVIQNQRVGYSFEGGRDTFYNQNVPVLATVEPFFEIGAKIEF